MPWRRRTPSLPRHYIQVSAQGSDAFGGGVARAARRICAAAAFNLRKARCAAAPGG
jgi:hypothetical protein